MVMVISSTKFGVANQEQCLSVGPPYLEMLFYMMVDIVTYIMLYHVISCYILFHCESHRSGEDHGNMGTPAPGSLAGCSDKAL